jgi:hypothetical protein
MGPENVVRRAQSTLWEGADKRCVIGTCNESGRTTNLANDVTAFFLLKHRRLSERNDGVVLVLVVRDDHGTVVVAPSVPRHDVLNRRRHLAMQKRQWQWWWWQWQW